MVQDAEVHAEEDKTRREVIELQNQADSLAYQIEKTLRELGDKVDSIEKGRIEGLIKDLRDAISQENRERMRGPDRRAAAGDVRHLAEGLRRGRAPGPAQRQRRRRQARRRRRRG